MSGSWHGPCPSEDWFRLLCAIWSFGEFWRPWHDLVTWEIWRGSARLAASGDYSRVSRDVYRDCYGVLAIIWVFGGFCSGYMVITTVRPQDCSLSRSEWRNQGRASDELLGLLGHRRPETLERMSAHSGLKIASKTGWLQEPHVLLFVSMPLTNECCAPLIEQPKCSKG